MTIITNHQYLNYIKNTLKYLCEFHEQFIYISHILDKNHNLNEFHNVNIQLMKKFKTHFI